MKLHILKRKGREVVAAENRSFHMFIITPAQYSKIMKNRKLPRNIWDEAIHAVGIDSGIQAVELAGKLGVSVATATNMKKRIVGILNAKA